MVAFRDPTAVVLLGVTTRERWGQLLRALRARVQRIEPRTELRSGELVRGFSRPVAEEVDEKRLLRHAGTSMCSSKRAAKHFMTAR
jgi:hypothetical protein